MFRFLVFVCKYMNQKVIEFNLSQRGKKMPELRSGDVVKVHRKIQEAGKERIQVFEGMVIAIKGGQSSSPMITVRKVSNGVGVELVLPVYSPMIEKIELVKRAKVKRSKLYYIREKTAKSLRFKFKALADLIAVDEKEEESEAKDEEEKKEEKAEGKKSEGGDKKEEAKEEKVKTETQDEKEKEGKKAEDKK